MGDLAVPGKAAVMTIDLGTQEWTRDWGDGARSGKVAELDVAFMERWLVSVDAGFDDDDRHGAAEMLRYVVHEHIAGRDPELDDDMYWFNPSGKSWSQSNDRGARVVSGLGWIIVWGAGIGWILFRGHRSYGRRRQ
jgi:hypothetical protein